MCATFSYPSEIRGAVLFHPNGPSEHVAPTLALCRAAELAKSVGVVACPKDGGALAWIAGPELCGLDLPVPSRADCPGAGWDFPTAVVAVVAPDPSTCDLSRIWFAVARAFADPVQAEAFVREAYEASVGGSVGAAGGLLIASFFAAVVAAWVSGMIQSIADMRKDGYMSASRPPRDAL